MNGLPAELAHKILSHAGDHAPATRAVCRRWQRLAPQRGAQTLYDLAAGGHEDLIRWIRANASGISPKASELLLCGAALGGHYHLCVYAKLKLGASNYDEMLYHAALGGHGGICRAAKRWGAADYRLMRRGAEAGCNKELCALADGWGAANAALPKFFNLSVAMNCLMIADGMSTLRYQT